MANHEQIAISPNELIPNFGLPTPARELEELSTRYGDAGYEVLERGDRKPGYYFRDMEPNDPGVSFVYYVVNGDGRLTEITTWYDQDGSTGERSYDNRWFIFSNSGRLQYDIATRYFADGRTEDIHAYSSWLQRATSQLFHKLIRAGE